MTIELHAISTTVSTNVSGYDGHLSAEVDSRPWGLNGGRSQYFDGDDCYVIVYKSDNVDIVSTFCKSADFDISNKKCGYNIHREGIAFSSPISSSSKPLDKPTIIFQNSKDASNPQYVKGSTLCRYLKWQHSTMNPKDPPPYGFIFIEHTPKAVMYMFSNLKRNTDLFSTPVHAVIFGVASPGNAEFSSFSA